MTTRYPTQEELHDLAHDLAAVQGSLPQPASAVGGLLDDTRETLPGILPADDGAAVPHTDDVAPPPRHDLRAWAGEITATTAEGFARQVSAAIRVVLFSHPDPADHISIHDVSKLIASDLRALADWVEAEGNEL